MTRARILASVVLAAVTLLALLLSLARRDEPGRGAGHSLTVYCAAGLKPPVEPIARAYEREFGVPIRLQYGGSGTLLSSLRIAGKGDLFVAGDESYLLIAQSNRLVREILPLATMRPVIAVRRGNPKEVRSIADLSRLRVALANPEAAAIGKVTRDCLRLSGQWDELEARARVFKPTVGDIANDIKLGTVDAGIVWDATVSQDPELEKIDASALAGGEQKISVGVLVSSAEPAVALRFARYLAARDRGLLEFARLGYQPVKSYSWAEAAPVEK